VSEPTTAPPLLRPVTAGNVAIFFFALTRRVKKTCGLGFWGCDRDSIFVLPKDALIRQILMNDTR
jgi:hypothetical protein